MEVWYREQQVNEVAERLGVAKTDVDLIFRNYVQYLQDRINSGKTVKVLNICYLKGVEIEGKLETLAYISTEIAEMTGMGRVTVKRVLSALEDMIVRDICDGVGFSVRGLIRIRLINEGGTNKVRIKKSTRYNGKSTTVVTLNAFRRKVAAYNAR